MELHFHPTIFLQNGEIKIDVIHLRALMMTTTMQCSK